MYELAQSILVRLVILRLAVGPHLGKRLSGRGGLNPIVCGESNRLSVCNLADAEEHLTMLSELPDRTYEKWGVQ